MFIGLWLLFGLIGLAIGIKKGYHPAIAILAGLILGIYSPLMLFLSSKRKKCSHGVPSTLRKMLKSVDIADISLSPGRVKYIIRSP